MSLEQIALTTNKSTSNVGDFVRKIGQGERGQVLPVLVTDASGSPYDLTNKKLVFSETKDSRMYVVDDGQATDAGKFNPTDPKNGKFSYTLQEQVYLESGTAWFDIVSQDGTVLDTTNAFRFVVIPDPTVNVKNGNYSSTLSALQAHYQAVISKTETNTQQLIDSLNDQITQAISNGQKDVAAELSDAKAKLERITTDANNLKNDWNIELGKQKQSLIDLQNQWETQTAQINQNADNQIKSINENASQQLKDNQAANNAEIERVEAAKNDAIKKINDQRDAAIAQASTNFQGEIIKLNQDYSAWKSEKLADFTKSLQNLTIQIETDQTNLTEFRKQLNDTKAEIEMLTKQLDSIDFAKNYFTKQEASDMKQNVLDTVGEQLKNKADNQSVIANQQRITALENAGYVKAKFDGFKSAEEARQWSEQNHGFSMFDDGQ